MAFPLVANGVGAVEVPRTFVLLNEVDEGQIGSEDGSSWGVEKEDDNTLTDWKCIVIGPPTTVFDGRFYSVRVTCGEQYPNQPPVVRFLTKTMFDGRFYSVRVTCGEQYPNQPPVVRFLTKINLHGIDPNTGMVNDRWLHCLSNWRSTNRIKDVLADIRRAMAEHDPVRNPGEKNQPPENAMFG